MRARKLLFESKICGACMKMCRHVCPTGQLVLKSEGSMPYSRGLAAFATRSELVPMNESVVEKIYQCATCKLCYSWCRPEVEVDLIVEDIRADAVQICPECIPGDVMKLAENVKQVSNPLGDAAGQRVAKIDQSLVKSTPGAEVGYFIGCVTAYRSPEIANGILRVLNEQGVEYQILGNDETCCAGPLVRAGHRDLAQKQAASNLAQFAEKGIQTIITGCPGCLHAFAIDYPDLFKLKDVPKAVHVMDFLLERGYKPTEKLAATATYHDPCHHARHLKDPTLYDNPRGILRGLGAEVKEMETTREKAQCCGAGGALRASNPEIAMQIGVLRIQEALATGAKYLVSTCPLCKQHLAEAAGKVEGSQLEIVDLFEIL